jgi:proline iminopeptidase
MQKHLGSSRARQGFIEGAGAKIFYKTVGAGPPLVVLHGGPGADHTDFLPFLLPLSRRHQLILMDERGCGRSERLSNPRGYTLDLMVEDIEQLRKDLGLRRMALMGHSFGGILAQAYAIRYSRRLDRLVLAGTAASAKAINADFANIRRVLPAAVRNGMAAFESRGIFRADGLYRRGYASLSARALAPYMYARRPPTSAPDYGLTGWEVLREMWVRRSDFCIDGNLKGFDFTRKLRRVNTPTLVVIGDHDMVSRESADQLRGSLPRAEIVVMKECGHMMFVDQTKRFNALLSDFLWPRATRRRPARGRLRRAPVRKGALGTKGAQ